MGQSCAVKAYEDILAVKLSLSRVSDLLSDDMYPRILIRKNYKP